MLTTTDPMDMTPEDRRREIAAILAAGFLRSRHRLTQPPDSPDAYMSPLDAPATAPDAAMSPPDAPSTAPDAPRRLRRNPPEFSRN
jgi:hypothetical protein